MGLLWGAMQTFHHDAFLFIKGCAMLGSVQGINQSCTSSACFEVFAPEFDEPNITCNTSAAAQAYECRCKFQVLDLVPCVLNSISDSNREARFNPTVSAGNEASRKYTSACRDAVEQHGPCMSEGIMDHAMVTMASKLPQLTLYIPQQVLASR
jgi:hypothetical protein